MAEFVFACKRSDIPPGGSKTVKIENKLIAIFDYDGTLCAIDDVCPHMGASLGGGEVEDGIVTCPWHGWRFKVCDGTWADNPKIKIPSFEVRIVGEDVQVCTECRPDPGSVSGKWME